MEIKDPNAKEWVAYVRKTVDEYIKKNPGCKMDNDAIAELTERTTLDIPLLRNSIIKLFLYTNHVKYEDVTLLVARPLDDNAFQIFNYLIVAYLSEDLIVVYCVVSYKIY